VFRVPTLVGFFLDNKNPTEVGTLNRPVVRHYRMRTLDFLPSLVVSEYLLRTHTKQIEAKSNCDLQIKNL
jgi:hypothetical protein